MNQVTVAELLKAIRNEKAGDLSATELEIIFEYRRHGDYMNSFLVSLGDLGRKDIRHEQGDTGTTRSFSDAKQFIEGFHLPYDLITGNYDLEGLQAWKNYFNKEKPYFSREI